MSAGLDNGSHYNNIFPSRWVVVLTHTLAISYFNFFKPCSYVHKLTLQFMVNHNIIYTDDKLKKANLTSDDMRHLCKKEKHTTKHTFLQCIHVVSFWKKFKVRWHYNTKENINFERLKSSLWTCQSPKAPESFKFVFVSSKIRYLQKQPNWRIIALFAFQTTT